MGLSVEQQQEIFKLAGEGLSPEAIRDKTGHTQVTVNKYLAKWATTGKDGVPAKSGEALIVRPDKGQMVNVLDLARTESDLGELGGQAGLVIGGVVDDLIEAADSTKPISIRLAKLTRGMIAGGSVLLTGYETVQRIREERLSKRKIKGTAITQDELKVKILELVGKEDKQLVIGELTELIGQPVDRNRITTAISELVHEGKLEFVS